jgi:hypothetical protein
VISIRQAFTSRRPSSRQCSKQAGPFQRSTPRAIAVARRGDFWDLSVDRESDSVWFRLGTRDEGSGPVSAIDDIISGIDGVIEQITEATTATSAVLQEAEQALGAAEALGANAAVEG